MLGRGPGEEAASDKPQTTCKRTLAPPEEKAAHSGILQTFLSLCASHVAWSAESREPCGHVLGRRREDATSQ